jgi:hypothetical protein
MLRWGMPDHLAVPYAQRQQETRAQTENILESGGTQMMRKSTGRVYQIVVRRELSDTYAVAFDGMDMETKNRDTILTGEIIDQPQLFGILERINGLGLELLSVHALPDEVHAGPEREQEEPQL